MFEAVYRREVRQLIELAEQLKDETSPVEALRRWLHSDIEAVATKKGMSAALALAVHGSSELYADSLERLAKAVGVLLDRAVAAGEIRSDISPKDFFAPSSACVTCTISPAGRRVFSAWWISSSMVFAFQ